MDSIKKSGSRIVTLELGVFRPREITNAPAIKTLIAGRIDPERHEIHPLAVEKGVCLMVEWQFSARISDAAGSAL